MYGQMVKWNALLQNFMGSLQIWRFVMYLSSNFIMIYSIRKESTPTSFHSFYSPILLHIEVVAIGKILKLAIEQASLRLFQLIRRKMFDFYRMLFFFNRKRASIHHFKMIHLCRISKHALNLLTYCCGTFNWFEFIWAYDISTLLFFSKTEHI